MESQAAPPHPASFGLGNGQPCGMGILTFLPWLSFSVPGSSPALPSQSLPLPLGVCSSVRLSGRHSSGSALRGEMEPEVGGLTSTTSEALRPHCPGPSLTLVSLQFLETWVPAHQPCQICMCLSGRKVNCTSQPCPTARGELPMHPPPCCSWRWKDSLEALATPCTYLGARYKHLFPLPPPAPPTWSRHSQRLVLSLGPSPSWPSDSESPGAHI